MCGICGIVRFRERVYDEELEAVKSVLAHRGPDGDGTYITACSENSGYIGLGHRRLSIIDLSENARQPMSNENGRIWLTYNGEIYNYQELRDELRHYGHIFKSKSDTEVIIHAYEQWAVECLERFNGMFALALWDGNNNELFLARDRLGIKPLYYYYEDNLFAFASELKGILSVKGIKRDLDYHSIDDYFSLQYIPAPRSAFKHIKKLEPGHFLLLKNARLVKKRYWALDYSRKSNLPIAILKEELRWLLSDSVKKRMISDVPVGAFLSGGLDSSIIVGLMRKETGNAVKTFSIGFNSEEYESELQFARMVSQKYNTDHHEEILDVDSLLNMLPDLVWYIDEPFADHSMVPTFLVSKLARKQVTVVLTGDGADENFAGYPRRYNFAHRLTQYEQIPECIRSLVEKSAMWILKAAMSLLPDTDNKRRMFRLFDILASTGMERIMALEYIFTNCLKRKIYSVDFVEQIDADSVASPSIKDVAVPRDLLEYKLCFDVHNYLVDDVLTKIDRMSMASSLEARVPFLDHRVVELAAKIPARLKLYNGQTKYILKNCFKDGVPEDIVARKKQGFGIPIKFWGKGRLNDGLRDMIKSSYSKARELFNTKEIEKMLDLTAAGKTNYSRELWSVLVLDVWCKQYCNGGLFRSKDKF